VEEQAQARDGSDHRDPGGWIYAGAVCICGEGTEKCIAGSGYGREAAGDLVSDQVEAGVGSVGWCLDFRQLLERYLELGRTNVSCLFKF